MKVDFPLPLPPTTNSSSPFLSVKSSGPSTKALPSLSPGNSDTTASDSNRLHAELLGEECPAAARVQLQPLHPFCQRPKMLIQEVAGFTRSLQVSVRPPDQDAIDNGSRCHDTRQQDEGRP